MRPTIDQTREYVARLFCGNVDKGGKPYHEHCYRVEAALPANATEDEHHAALLHDVIEDTDVTDVDLSRMGYADRTVALVMALSRPKSLTYMDYIRTIAASGDPGLIAIKMADNADNSDPARIAALPEDERDIVRRYERARKILTSPPAPPQRLGE